jgi:23S rRNA pseudouridine2605 synthase
MCCLPLKYIQLSYSSDTESKMSYKKKQTGNQPYYATFLRGDEPASKSKTGASSKKPSNGNGRSAKVKPKGRAAFANSGEFSPRKNTMYGKPDAYRPKRNPYATTPQNDNKDRVERPVIDRKETNRSINRSFEDRPAHQNNDSRPFYKKDDNGRSGNDRGSSPRSSFRPRTEERNDRSGNDRPAFRPRTEERNDRSGNDRSGNDRPAFRPRTEERNDRSDSPRTDGRSERSNFSSRNTDSNGRPAYKSRSNEGSGSERPAPRPRTTESDPKKERDTESRRSGRHREAPTYDMGRATERSPRMSREVKKKDDEKDGLTRLNKYIANSGVCSRREADELIEASKITINGTIVSELGYKVKPEDVVKYGNQVLNPEKMVYLLLNKPKGYITTTDDPDERKTVMDLIEGACKERIYPVGRLDRNTTGLLLFTNDGELAKKLMHPSNQATKIYQAELDKPLTTEHFEQIKEGLELEDGFIKPDDFALVTPDAEVVGVEIHSGKNRIVRRIFEHLGYDVQKLDRTVYAGLNKKELPRGHWRFLNEREVVKLKYLL